MHNKRQPSISKKGPLSVCEAVLGQSLGSSSSLARGTLSYWLCPISRQMSSNTSQPLPLSPCPLPTHLLFLCSPFPQVSKRVFCSPCFHFFLSPAFPNPLSLDSSLSLPFLCTLTASLPICLDLSAGAPPSGDPPSPGAPPLSSNAPSQSFAGSSSPLSSKQTVFALSLDHLCPSYYGCVTNYPQT